MPSRPKRTQNTRHHPICGAKNRQGEPCRRPPAAARTRCRLHGGATPRGWESPHWKHGQYSNATRLLFPVRVVAESEGHGGFFAAGGGNPLPQKALASSRSGTVARQPLERQAPGHAVSERTQRRRQQRLRAELTAELESLERGALGRRLRRRRMPWANVRELQGWCWLTGTLGGRPKRTGYRCTKRLGSRFCWNWRAVGSDRCWRHKRARCQVSDHEPPRTARA
jgi:hypothetical protein